MLFDATVHEFSPFIAIINAMSKIVHETSIHADKEGMTFSCMSSDHIVAMRVKLASEFFEAFSCVQETDANIKIHDLLKILKRLKDTRFEIMFMEDNSVTISATSSRGRRMKFMIKSFTADSTALQDSVKIRDLIDKIEEALEPQFSLSMYMDPRAFVEILEDANIFSDEIMFRKEEGNLIFEAMGEAGDMLVDIELGVDIVTDFEDLKKGDEIRTSYNVHMLKDVMIAFLHDDDTSPLFRLGNNVPLVITQKIYGRGNNIIGSIIATVAPRVTQEEDQYDDDDEDDASPADEGFLDEEELDELDDLDEMDEDEG